MTSHAVPLVPYAVSLISGTNIDDARLSDETDIDETDIDEIDIDETDIDETDIEETDIDETNIDETDIDETDIEETDIEEAANMVHLHTGPIPYAVPVDDVQLQGILSILSILSILDLLIPTKTDKNRQSWTFQRRSNICRHHSMS